MAYLQLNNVRKNNAWIQLNVNETGWNNSTTKTKANETKSILIEDATGNAPSTFTSLGIKVHKKDDPSGSGVGELTTKAEKACDSATSVLGDAAGSPTNNTCLAIKQDSVALSTAFTYIEGTG